MHSSRQLIKNFLSVLTSREPLEIEERSRRQLFAVFLLLLITPLFIFGTVHLQQGYWNYAVTDYIMGFIFFAMIFSLRYLKNSAWNFRIAVFLVEGLLTYWMFTGAVAGAASIWIIAFPPFVFFLLGKKEGIIWTLTMVFLAIFIFFNPFRMDWIYSFNIPFAARILATLLVVIFFTYNYESLRIAFLKKLKEEHNNLLREKDQLSREMEIRIATEEELIRHRNRLEELVNARTMELQQKNSELENALSETRALNEELAASEKRLYESEKRYRILADNATDLIWATDINLNFTYMSPAVVSLYGYSVEEAMVLPHEKWNTPESFSKVMNAYIEHINLEKTGTADPDRAIILELQQLKKDGTLFWTELKVSFIRDKEGTATGIIGITRDVTERRRTQELLTQTEKMMSVGGLAAGMAHEINNPLSIIMNSIQNLQRRTSPSLPRNREAAIEAGTTIESIENFFAKRKIGEYIAYIYDASKRASEIVIDMLQFSRRSEAVKESVDINLLIEKALDLCSKDYDFIDKYDFKKIQIERNYSDDIPAVACIKTEVEQVLLNILKNASHAIKEISDDSHMPCISISTEAENNMCIIRISDNGIGIPASVLTHIFEPFFTTKQTGAGTGLGLSVSYFIITSHHDGSIKVDSEEGHGTTFTISLPL